MSAAEVIDLDTWRDWRLIAHIPPRPPREHGWHDLAAIALTDTRDAIRIYTRLGLHPIAIHGVDSGACTCGRADCAAVGKHPVARGWQRSVLHLDALDEQLIETPTLNVGLRMGRQPSGVTLIAIDVDGDRSLLAPLEAKVGKLPDTLTQSTGKGLHLIYEWPEGRAMPKNRVSLAPGVDVRSEGGQIVCAPSTHYSGRRYRWLEARKPEVLP